MRACLLRFQLNQILSRNLWGWLYSMHFSLDHLTDGLLRNNLYESLHDPLVYIESGSPDSISTNTKLFTLLSDLWQQTLS